MSQNVVSRSATSMRGAWFIVGATFFMLSLNSGTGFYVLGAFEREYINTTGITLTAASAGATIFLLSAGLGGLPVARWIPRYGIRRIIIVSVLLSAVTLVLQGYVTQAWQLWAVSLIRGLASAGFSLIPGSTMVLDKFVGHAPARPLAVAAAGISVGGAVFTPVITSSIENHGLVTTVWVMAIGLVILIIPVILLAKPTAPIDTYQDAALQPHATEHHEPETIEANNRPLGIVFAMVCVAFGLLIISQVAAIAHLLILGQERNIGNITLAVSAIAGMAVVGRIIGFIVLPHLSLKFISLAMSAMQVTALILIATGHSLPQLFLGAALIGLTVGNNQVLIPLWILALYGIDRYAHLFARASLYTAIGMSLSPFLIGFTHEFSGGYTLPFFIVAAGSLGAGFCILALPSKLEVT
ncbi:MAG: MFS transporter [Actinomycetes bacterium]